MLGRLQLALGQDECECARGIEDSSREGELHCTPEREEHQLDLLGQLP